MDYDQIWRRWSDSMAEIEGLIIRILTASARSPAHLIIKHRTIVAQLKLDNFDNPGLLDDLHAFGRDLAKLVG